MTTEAFASGAQIATELQTRLGTQCLRSYQHKDITPNYSDVDHYTWSIYEAAIATCIPHPYDSPFTIRGTVQDLSLINLHDAAMHGHGNPIETTITEADTLFGKHKTIFISIGPGEFSKHTPDVESKPKVFAIYR